MMQLLKIFKKSYKIMMPRFLKYQQRSEWRSGNSGFRLLSFFKSSALDPFGYRAPEMKHQPQMEAKVPIAK